MRLICPNCGAQYEVDGSVIPETGRDVQCSNCGHTWFKRHANQDAEGVEDNIVAAPVDPQSEIEPEQEYADSTDHPEDIPSPPDEQIETVAAERQTIDPEVANVLREEAELETSQRSSTPETTEGSPEQAVEQAIAESESIFEEQTAQLHSDVEAADSTRRDLLPDIEEINSTLAATTATAATAETDESTEQNRRISFRRGLLAAMVVFAVMALVYVFAPRIVDAIPQSTSVLSSYVDWINGLRVALDNSMLGVVDKLTGLLAQLNGEQSS